MTILALEVNDFIEARLSELNFTEPCVANLTQNNNDTKFLAAFSEFVQFSIVEAHKLQPYPSWKLAQEC